MRAQILISGLPVANTTAIADIDIDGLIGQAMLFFSFFKTLVDQEVVVELKNDLEIKGTLKSVDQFLNLKLDNISTVNEEKYPHLKAVKNLFVRGSTVRYVHLSASSVDCTLLQDASRRGM